MKEWNIADIEEIDVKETMYGGPVSNNYDIYWNDDKDGHVRAGFDSSNLNS